MNNSNNLGKTILKATISTTIIFLLSIFSNDFDVKMIGFILIFIIPISIVCCLTIVFTIMPFFWFTNKNTDKRILFKKYFPFYAIVAFLFFLYQIVNSDFQDSLFFIIAFFILMQSWIWLCKPDDNNIS